MSCLRPNPLVCIVSFRCLLTGLRLPSQLSNFTLTFSLHRDLLNCQLHSDDTVAGGPPPATVAISTKPYLKSGAYSPKTRYTYILVGTYKIYKINLVLETDDTCGLLYNNNVLSD